MKKKKPVPVTMAANNWKHNKSMKSERRPLIINVKLDGGGRKKSTVTTPSSGSSSAKSNKLHGRGWMKKIRSEENLLKLHSKGKSTVWDAGVWSVDDFIWASRDGLLEIVQAHLEASSAHIHDMDEDGFTALHHAARYNRVKVLEALLDAGANVNIKGGQDESRPLHMAARYNSDSVVQLLLARGAQVNVKDIKGRTPLHYATRRGHDTVTKMLLSSAICDVNAADNDLTTPLIMAAMQGNQDVSELLISRGAQIGKKDVNDMTALMWSASEGHLETAAVLIKAAVKHDMSEGQRYVRLGDNEGNTALHLAVQNGCYQVCELLLDNGAEVNCKKINLATPLHVAATCGFLDIVDLLLHSGASVNIKDCDQLTPIHKAALYNKISVINLLMNHGGDINAKDKKNMSPLHCACWKGQAEAVEYLLNHGAQIAEADSSLKTALHWTVQFGHYETLMILIKHDGKTLLEFSDKNDQTVLHYAAYMGNSSVLKTLIDAGANPDAKDQEERTPLHIAAQYDNVSCVEVLIQASNHETNDDDVDGRTPLLLACMNGNYQVVQVLLSLGADVSKRDDEHCTALMLTAARGHVGVMRILLENHASVNDVDKMKNTALHYACAGGHTESVQLLLNKKVKVSLKNAHDLAPLDLAVDNMHNEVALTMLKHKSWRECMTVRDNSGRTILDRLIAKLPEAAQVLLDHCVERTSRDDDDPNLMLVFDYQYIDPGSDDIASTRSGSRYFALNTMLDHQRVTLLSHPLCQNILSQKWVRFGRRTFYLNLFVYTGFLLTLTGYIATMDGILQSPELYKVNASCPVNMTDELREMWENNWQSKLFGIMLLVFVILFTLKELGKIFIQKLRYFINGFHWIGWILLGTSYFFLTTFGSIPCLVHWRAGWMSVFLAWINFIMYLRRIDFLGIYVIMFVTVLISLLKAIIVYFLFVFAFAGSFYIIMARTAGFSSIWKSGLNVMVMTLGEVDYESTFINDDKPLGPFVGDANFLLAIFIFLMPIVLMNLMIGIAVGDIEKVQHNAYLKRIALQVELLYNIESSMPAFLQRKSHVKRATVKPNEAITSLWLKVHSWFFGSSRQIHFIEDTQKDRTLDMFEEVKDDLNITRIKLRGLQATVQQQTALLEQIASHLEVREAGVPAQDMLSNAGSIKACSGHDTLSIYDNISIGRMSRTKSVKNPVDLNDRPRSIVF